METHHSSYIYSEVHHDIEVHEEPEQRPIFTQYVSDRGLETHLLLGQPPISETIQYGTPQLGWILQRAISVADDIPLCPYHINLHYAGHLTMAGSLGAVSISFYAPGINHGVLDAHFLTKGLKAVLVYYSCLVSLLLEVGAI